MRSLAVLLFLTGLPLPAMAQTASDCHKQDSSIERLKCYDNVTKYKGGKQEEDNALAAKTVKLKAVVSKGKWQVREEISKVDDSKNVFLSLAPNEANNCPFKRSPHRLTLRCVENTTAMTIYFGGCFMSSIQGRGRVTFRADKEKPVIRNLIESTDHQTLGLWSGGKSIPFIKTILDNERLYVRATPFSESSIDATYDVRGLAEAIKPLRKACDW